MACFVLVPSPFLGPSSWGAVAGELTRRGSVALVPALADSGAVPFWPQHAAAAAIAVPQVDDLVLVAHRESGPLLPAIAEAAGRRVSTYLFVDACLPRAGASRLQLLREESSRLAEEVEDRLRHDGRYPAWTDESLRDEIPDTGTRSMLLAEVQPRPAAFFEEPLPVPPTWPDAGCAYLRLSRSYEVSATRAESEGCAVKRLDLGRFSTVTDPEQVAGAILAVTGRG